MDRLSFPELLIINHLDELHFKYLAIDLSNVNIVFILLLVIQND